MGMAFVEFGSQRLEPDRGRPPENEIETEDARIDTFLKIEALDKSLDKKRKINPETRETLHDLFKSVEDAIARYANTVASHTMAKREEFDRQDIERSDEARRFAHNALIDKLDILARSYRINGLDAGWRDEIGADRNRVREWAQIVMKYIAAEAERKEI